MGHQLTKEKFLIRQEILEKYGNRDIDLVKQAENVDHFLTEKPILKIRAVIAEKYDRTLQTRKNMKNYYFRILKIKNTEGIDEPGVCFTHFKVGKYFFIRTTSKGQILWSERYKVSKHIEQWVIKNFKNDVRYNDY